jgi:tRNA threonylcarbamoyladenosine biosynthesis protein TsaB
MSDPLILHIDTATSICSVAISRGKQIIALRETDEPRSHAASLSVFIRECLEETRIEIKNLDALHVSRGPGSYTGLRIGVSTVKGMAYAHGIPVIATGTLHILAQSALKQAGNRVPAGLIDQNTFLCPMIDARRMEVYTAIFNPDGSLVREVKAEIIDSESFLDILSANKMIFFGDGSMKCREVITHQNAHFLENILPSAQYMVEPALEAFMAESFQDVAYFEPFYLKEFIATIPKKKVL